jgi:hypothetical protein
MAQRYRVTWPRPVDLACGQMVASGAVTKRVKPSDPHDKWLIDEGRLVLLPPKRQPRKSTKQEESK